MIPQKQRIVDHIIGDCFAACMASLLELPIEVVPHDCSEGWWHTWYYWLRQFGLEMTWHPANGPIWQSNYWIALVKSKNFKEVTHAIVMDGSEVAFDPSTAKGYKKGYSALGRDFVIGGYVISVVDFTKLHKLQEYRDKLAKSKAVTIYGTK